MERDSTDSQRYPETVPFFPPPREIQRRDARRIAAKNIASSGKKDMPFRRPVASFRSATASGQKEMTYGGCARPSEAVDSAEVRKKGREEDRAGGGGVRGGGDGGQETNDGGPWLPRTTQ